jgi:flagellar hook-associated protein 1 FlgK
MADILSTGVSGLLAFQRALDTTSHNIANANTPGYNRQVVDLAARTPEQVGGNWIGKGVDIANVRRLYDQTLTEQARTANSSLQQLDTFATYADRLDKLFSNSSTGLAASLQQYSNALETLSTSPSSGTARQLVLSQSQTLVNRLKGFQSTLDSLSSQMGSQLGAEAGTVNSLAQSIATLNQQIVAASGSGLQKPNDLLDKRDTLLAELGQHVAVTTVTEDNGAMSVYIGSGQTLVTNTTASKLTVAAGTGDRSEQHLMLSGAAAPTDVSGFISGGTIGGLLQLQSSLLTPAQNTLGQIATTITTLANKQQQAGLDLSGNFGGPLFTVPAPTAVAAQGNQGTAGASVTVSDVSALTTFDYDLRYSGTSWSLQRHDNGVAVAMTGSGTVGSPFNVDGLSIVLSGTPQAGDSIMVRPTHDVVAGLGVLITSPDKVAAAAPLLTAAAATNAGTGTIDDGIVTTPGSWVRGSYMLSFTSGSAWQVTDSSNAVVASGSYTAGGNISFNGMTVAVSGAPAAGDSFSINDNSNGSGDGRNARALTDLLDSKVMAGGTISVADAIGGLVGNIGVQSSQAQAGRDAQSAVLTDASSALSNATGVNLDEEAANLLRYQQAYQAAARVITAANQMFQALIDATRR